MENYKTAVLWNKKKRIAWQEPGRYAFFAFYFILRFSYLRRRTSIQRFEYAVKKLLVCEAVFFHQHLHWFIGMDQVLIDMGSAYFVDIS